MPRKRTPEEQREYMKTYRAKKKAVALTDKDRGLPRSNYYSDHKAKGGWADTIRNISPALTVAILDHPAIRSKR